MKRIFIALLLITAVASLAFATDSSDEGEALPTLSGIVTHGERAARELGFPTANIVIEDLDLSKGVYACLVKLAEKEYHGMGYTDARRPQLFETHILDFSDDIYGQALTVKPIKLIRPPETFTTVERLKELLAKDLKKCQKACKQALGVRFDLDK